MVRYPGGITLVWIALAVIGLGLGFAMVGSGERPEAAFAGLGLGVIATFVAWFAANPAIVADHARIGLFPIFGTRTTFRWDEIRTIGVCEVRGARGRGPALLLEATDEREAKIDSLWVGATRGNLDRIDAAVRLFARSAGVVGPAAASPPVPVDDSW